MDSWCRKTPSGPAPQPRQNEFKENSDGVLMDRRNRRFPVKRIFQLSIVVTFVAATHPAPGADEFPCTGEKAAYQEAVDAGRAKAELTSCAEKRGSERQHCEKLRRDALEKIKQTKEALEDCLDEGRYGPAIRLSPFRRASPLGSRSYLASASFLRGARISSLFHPMALCACRRPLSRRAVPS
jgi:hypothetical protein